MVARAGRREAAVAVAVGAVGKRVAEAMAAGADQMAVEWAGVESVGGRRWRRGGGQ